MRALEDIAALYAPVLGDASFFASPERVHFRFRSAGVRRDDVEVRDARFTSRVETYASDVSARFERVVENREAAARFYDHTSGPRPTIVLVHGYRSGQYAIEEVAWPIDWMLSQGLDVVVFVLPFHGLRAAPGRGPAFPSSDPRFTIEGFRQAIGDLRALVRHLHERGSKDVGVMGMSLGGYTAALFASLEPSLAFAIPMIPLASFADVAREANRLVGSASERDLQHTALERAFAIASPLHRPLAIGVERTLVIAAEVDRITPPSHAKKIATHWGSPLSVFPGGHILQLGRREGFRSMMALLRREGILPARG